MIARVLCFLTLCVFALAFALFAVVRMPILTVSHEDKSLEVINPDSLENHVRQLTEVHTPRTCFSDGTPEKAAAYIYDELSQWSANTYLQTYEFNNKEYSNVISEQGPDTDDVIIVGAHYDAYMPFPGADDNASGVAGVLEINRLLSTAELKKRVILVAYSCEEPPHFSTSGMGSVVHAKSITNKDVSLMISLEMIGYFLDEPNSQDFPVKPLSLLYPNKGDFIAVIGKIFTMDASKLKASINRSTDLEAYSINAPVNLPGIDFSDHRSYWNLKYPAVMVSDTAFYRNKNYHKRSDTYDTLDYDRMAQVVYGVYNHVVKLSNH